MININRVLENLEPKLVFQYFEDLCQIPRCSGNERAVSDYLVNFAKSKNLEVIQDKALNVIIKKPGTPGYENAPTVILQGHMDMVCEKNKGTIHDFDKDPLKLRVIDDMIYATGTTLGADDGIAVAIALAILASDDIAHPPLEVVITTSEETGMDGAIALDFANLKGRLLINMDSEEEGKLLVSCAGGITTRHTVPILWEDSDKNAAAFSIEVGGLRGGHSGIDISKGRGNSNKILGRILSSLDPSFEFSIARVSGGSKNNAIPRESDAIILIDPKSSGKLEEKIREWDATLKNELKASDPEVFVSLNRLDETFSKVFSKDTKQKVIASLVLIPNGIHTMSMEIQGLVESSTNLGVVATLKDAVTFESAVRSSVRSLKQDILNESEMAARTIGCQFQAFSDYPEWPYNPDSKLKTIFEKVYKNKFGKDPEIVALHAGVECGLFKEKQDGLDMISLGPNMFDVHTPNEHLSISSTKRTWEYILAALKEIK